MKHGLKMTLTSFICRDECFNLIWALWVKAKGDKIEQSDFEDPKSSNDSYDISNSPEH